MFLEVSEKHAPMKSFNGKSSRPPWLTSDLLKMMHKRDEIHEAACRSSHCSTSVNIVNLEIE